MAKIMIPLFMLSLLTLLPYKALSGNNLIHSTCKATPNYQLCVATFQKDHRSSGAPDVRALSLIIVDALKAKTVDALKQINSMQRTKPGLRGPLSECTRVYNAVLKADIPVAIEALTKGNPKFAENGVADAAVEAQICQHGLGSVLSGVNNGVEDLSGVARAVIRTLL